MTEIESEKICTFCERKYTSEADFLKYGSRWRICSREMLWFNCSCNSTLVLKKGAYSWYNPCRDMKSKAASVFNELKVNEALPHIPSLIMELQSLLDDAKSETKDIVEALKKEPIIAANVLETSNNLKAASGQAINSLEHALTFVGRKSVKDLILISGVRQFEVKSKAFDIDKFWKQSFLQGFIAEKMVEQLGLSLSPENVYFGGTLANIGKLTLAVLLPEQCDDTIAYCAEDAKDCNWVEFEKNTGTPYTHSVLGEISSVFWGLPGYVRDAAAHHHNTDKVLVNKLTFPFSIKDLAAIAIQLSHYIIGESEKADPFIVEAFKEKAGMSHLAIEKILNVLEREASAKKLI